MKKIPKYFNLGVASIKTIGIMERVRQRIANRREKMLPQEIKDKIESAMVLIYEWGENRDDVMDNLNDSVAHLVDASNEADYLEYRFECEARYEEV